MFKNGIRAVHPGEVLFEDYIKPTGMSVRAVAMALSVSYSRLNAIAKGRRGIDADMALRLERYFGNQARGWLNLQAAYDLRTAEVLVGKAIAKVITPLTSSVSRKGKSKYSLAELIQQCDMSADQTTDLTRWKDLKAVGREKN